MTHFSQKAIGIGNIATYYPRLYHGLEVWQEGKHTVRNVDIGFMSMRDLFRWFANPFLPHKDPDYGMVRKIDDLAHFEILLETG